MPLWRNVYHRFTGRQLLNLMYMVTLASTTVRCQASQPLCITSALQSPWPGPGVISTWGRPVNTARNPESAQHSSNPLLPTPVNSQTPTSTPTHPHARTRPPTHPTTPLDATGTLGIEHSNAVTEHASCACATCACASCAYANCACARCSCLSRVEMRVAPVTAGQLHASQWRLCQLHLWCLPCCARHHPALVEQVQSVSCRLFTWAGGL